MPLRLTITLKRETAQMAASVRGASFKGLAILGGRLYATDLKNARVDVIPQSMRLNSATACSTRAAPWE